MTTTSETLSGALLLEERTLDDLDLHVTLWTAGRVLDPAEERDMAGIRAELGKAGAAR